MRRAQLAVIAHIRHTYTNYDALLKLIQYNEARRRVEQPCLDRLIRWRGDDDDAGDMEDVLREVIVIPDDDEDDGKQESLRMRSEEHERDSSIEYISETDMQVQPVDYSNVNRTIERGGSFSPESDKEIQYLGRKQLRYGPHQHDQHTLERMGAHRQRVYEEALDRRRNHPENLTVYTDHSSLPLPINSDHDNFYPLSQQPQGRSFPPQLNEREKQALAQAPIQTRPMPVAGPYNYTTDPYSSLKDSNYIREEQVSPAHNKNELGMRKMDIEVSSSKWKVLNYVRSPFRLH